ncbi:hypothetical protein R6Q57_027166 [Mikania cordata]
MNEKTAKMHQGRGNEEVEKGGEETRRLEAEKGTVNDREQRYIPDLQQRHEADNKLNKNVTKVFVPEGGSSNGLDVLSARG